MPEQPFANRESAGFELAKKLRGYANKDSVIVLALPRGGVPVAYEVAVALNVRLDLMLVRKLGLPSHEELAMGAIASGGVRILNHSVVDSYDVTTEEIEATAERELRELTRRERTYRGERPWPGLKGQSVILVDDGLATGATMRAAIEATRAQGAKDIVMAVPVAPMDTAREFAPLVKETVALKTPAPFNAVGQWYFDFGQTSDEEVLTLLSKAWQREKERHHNTRATSYST